MPNTTIVSSSKPVISTKTPPPLITSMPGKSTFSGDSMSNERTSSVSDSMSTEPKMKPQQRKSFRINRGAIATICGVGLIGFGIIGTVYSKTIPTEPKTELQQMGGLDDLVGIATVSGVVLLSINSLHGQFTNLNDKIDNKSDTLGNKSDTLGNKFEQAIKDQGNKFEQAIKDQGNKFEQAIKDQGTEFKEDIREIRNQNNNIYQIIDRPK